MAPLTQLARGAGGTDVTQPDPSVADGQQEPPVPVQDPGQEPAMPDTAMPDMNMGASGGDTAVAGQTSDATANPDAGVTPAEQPSDVAAGPAALETAAQEPSDVAATPGAAQTAPVGDEGAVAPTKPPGSGLNHGALAEELIAERQHQAMGDTPPAAPSPATMVPYTVTEGAHTWGACILHALRRQPTAASSGRSPPWSGARPAPRNPDED